MAQMRVVTFKLLENDLTANTRGTEKPDQNGEKAALIKIQTPERGFSFDGGMQGIVATEEHVGEIWLYVPRRAQKLIIQHRDYGVLRDYFYPIPIEGGKTYELLVDIGTGRYATVTTAVAKAEVFIDGEPCGQSPVRKYLSYGRHTVRATKDRFEGETTATITTGDYHLDNNLVERLNRYISLSRRNSLFFGSHKGAGRGAMYYSLACSCRMQGISFFEYISDVINKTAALPPNTHLSTYRELLPDRWKAANAQG